MDTYHDNYVVDMSRGQELENGYGYGGRPRAQYQQYGASIGDAGPGPASNAGAGIGAGSGSGSGTGPGPSVTPTPPTATGTGAGASAPPRRMSSSSLRPEMKNDPVTFDEGIIRGLCSMDCAQNLLVDRVKQSVQSCKALAQFLTQRATVETKYAQAMSENARSSNDQYSRSEGKPGSFVVAFQTSLRLQEQLAMNRARFSQRLQEMSDEINGLAREGERQRKLHKENGTRFLNALQDSDQQMDKAKARLDSTTEELERVLVAKEGENYRDANLRTDALPSSNNKRGIGKALNKGLFKGKNPAQMQKHEDEVRQRMTSASEAYRKAAIENQTLRKEYYDKQLPKVVRALKECADELDNGMQYHLARYAFIYESTVGSEASTLIGSPDDGPGLKAIYERIDNRSDFKAYMQNYVVAVKNQSWVPRRDGLDEVSTQAQQPLPQTPQVQVQQQQSSTPAPPPSLPNLSTNGNGIANTHAQHQQQHQQPSQQPPQQQQNLQPQPPMPMGDSYTPSPIAAITGATFGVDLGDQLVRDNAEVPKVVVNCAEAIEEYGLDSMGIYRLSGTTSKVQALKNALDKDIDAVNIMDEQWSGDINVVSSALKLWFRELPEPLLTYGLYHGFVDAARYENDRLRHIRLHEQVNELPDPNYATLKYFMGHLDKIRRKEGVNQMSASNLSIVFGPTLLGAPPEEGGLNLEHMNYQCKAIETILDKYQEIFVEEGDDDESADAAQ